jgi:hypothetical protein
VPVNSGPCCHAKPRRAPCARPGHSTPRRWRGTWSHPLVVLGSLLPRPRRQILGRPLWPWRHSGGRTASITGRQLRRQPSRQWATCRLTQCSEHWHSASHRSLARPPMRVAHLTHGCQSISIRNRRFGRAGCPVHASRCLAQVSRRILVTNNQNSVSLTHQRRHRVAIKLQKVQGPMGSVSWNNRSQAQPCMRLYPPLQCLWSGLNFLSSMT